MSDGMTRIEIVPYQPAHRDDVLQITKDAWSPVFARSETQLPQFVLRAFFPDGWMPRQLSEVSALVEEEADQIWVAISDERVVGFVGLRIHEEDSMGEIYIIAVSPDSQRSGTARALIDHSEAVIRERGMAMVMVETIGDEGHTAARKTYESLDYERWPVARYFKPLD